MQALLNAVKSFIANDTANHPYMGLDGPYLWLPRPTPRYPYILITQVGGTPNWQGFGSTYVARARLRIALWDEIADDVMTHGEYVASKLDTVPSLTLMNGTASSSDVCRLPIRIEEPRFIVSPIDENGIQVFGCILEYRFNVQRTRGA